MSIIDGINKIKKDGRRGEGKRIFLLLKPEITQTLADGYSIKTVWRSLHEQQAFEISYRTFAEYVAKYIPINRHTKADQFSIEPDTSLITDKLSKTERLQRLKAEQELHNAIPDKDSLI